MDTDKPFREYKFVLNPRQGKAMRSRVTEFLQPKRHEPEGVCVFSEYFDTPDRDAYWDWQFGTADQLGIRTRLFKTRGTITPAKAFLETRQRINGITVKRRLRVAVNDLEALHQGKWTIDGNTGTSDTWREIGRILGTREKLPAIQISYQRQTFEDASEGDLRILFDRNVSCRLPHASLLSNAAIFDQPILTPGWFIMELKTTDAVPEWLRRLLVEYHLGPRGFSKYAAAVELEDRLHNDYLYMLPVSNPDQRKGKLIGDTKKSVKKYRSAPEPLLG